MPRKNEAPADMFMNFAGVASRSHPTSGDTLQETVFQTGLSVRGQLIWLIHLVEFYTALLTANNSGWDVALSTRQGLPTMPQLNDHGLIARIRYRYGGAIAAGMFVQPDPQRQSFLPPLPISAAALSVYIQGFADHADSDDQDMPLRIGFTTAPVDAGTYVEIAELWGQ